MNQVKITSTPIPCNTTRMCTGLYKGGGVAVFSICVLQLGGTGRASNSCAPDFGLWACLNKSP